MLRVGNRFLDGLRSSSGVPIEEPKIGILRAQIFVRVGHVTICEDGD
jgi:hypothetical protein